MTLVQRANVILEVKDDAVERMLDMGYNVIDREGNVLQPAPIRDIGGITKLYNEKVKEVEELQVKVKDLKAEIAKLKARNKNAKKD